ncbi:MAG: asparagine--tRNA ligase [Candidatus Lightella neohaematopini]|nr:asparagine--tRNA ligase [Candidatus Lightella neohaematopini]
MYKICIKNIINGLFTNQHITVCGWVKTRRDSKIGISFLNINDGSCISNLQIIIKSNIKNYSKILKLTSGCSVQVNGLIIKSPKSKQSYEMQATSVLVTGWVDNPRNYPISAKLHSLEHLRKFAHLRIRTNIFSAITRIRSTVFTAIHNFMNKNNFILVTTPIITSIDTEGYSTMFSVLTNNKKFFDKKYFLTVSGQLNIESYACALSKVYTFGPVFRAEKSNTSRHLAEFWMVEPEIAFADLQNIIDLTEDMLKYIFKHVLDERIQDLEFCVKYNNNKNLIRRLNNFINNGFVHISYDEAVQILEKYKNKFNKQIAWGYDFSLEHENYLTNEHFKNIVVITNYPKNIKAFYMRVNTDNKTVAAMDVIAQDIGEIAGGSQREERLNKLDICLKEKNLSAKNYWWYRDLRKYGTVPHSGFGIGLERLISYITGMYNIRDVIPFPRGIYDDINF